MNLGHAIDGMLVRSRAVVEARVLPRPVIRQGKGWRRKVILEALAERSHTFGELRVVARYRRDNQLSAMLSNLRREGLIANRGTPARYRYELRSARMSNGRESPSTPSGEATDAVGLAKVIVGSAFGHSQEEKMLAREVIRLNEWADGMTDAMLKERRLADATIKELRAPVSETSSSVSVPVSFAKWAAATLEESRSDGGGDLDGGFLFDLAEDLGVITPVKVTEACDPTACNCAENDGFPTECYRYTPEVREAITRIEAIK